MNVSSILKAILCCCVIFLFSALHAQTNGSAIEHVIKKGETLSALAQQYHTTVGDIMRLNGMNSKSVLRIGEKVKIPVKGTKVAQAEAPVLKQTKTVATTSQNEGKTIIHIVEPKETLYAISRKYKVTVAQIQQWNHLTSTNIHTGQHLTIGTEASEPVVAKVSEPVTHNENVPTTTPAKPAAANTSAVAPVVQNANTSVENNTTKNQVIPVNNSSNSNTDDIPTGGFFTDFYKQTGQSISGDASIFKTASGWMDKKYYILINNIPEGTVVKIESNQKVVYAKVLGALPNIKEDDGLLLRISNAAAAVLGMADKRFPVTVQY